MWWCGTCAGDVHNPITEKSMALLRCHALVIGQMNSSLDVFYSYVRALQGKKCDRINSIIAVDAVAVAPRKMTH
jgi:hypothetical protein